MTDRGRPTRTGRVVCLLALGLLFLTGCAGLFSAQKESVRQSSAHQLMGQTHLEQNRLQDAFLEFQKAVADNPDNKEAWNLLGVVYVRLDQYQDAVKAYERALAIDSQFSEGHNNMASALNEMGRHAEAIQAGEKALQNPLYPTPEYAFNNIGFAQMKMGQNDEAIKSFKKALLRRPLPQARYNLAMAYVAIQRDNAALAELQELVSQAPQYVDAQYQLGMLYLRMGDIEKARDRFKKAATIAPDSEFGIRADDELRKIR